MVGKPNGLEQLAFEPCFRGPEALALEEDLAAVRVSNQEVTNVVADLAIVHDERDSDLAFPTLDPVRATSVL